MPNINKQSLREELDTYKNRFQTLNADNKMTPESRALIEGLLMLFELMLAIFLEKTTNKNSKNSSKPSSQTDKDETTPASGTKSKGKAEDDKRFSPSETHENVTISSVSQCQTCAEDLTPIESQGHERRTQIDIQFVKIMILIKLLDFCM